MEYVIYCDESEKTGKYYGNFYGGVLVRSTDLAFVVRALEQKKQELNLHGEVKWTKVTANYLDKYIELIDTFFDLVEQDRIKVRIMFTQAFHKPTLRPEHKNKEFFLLYYQFVKHAFGLVYSNPQGFPINLRIYFDRLPDKKEECDAFKSFIYRLKWSHFRAVNLRMQKNNITEVESHEHVLLQCLDIVLGAMQFRLNDGHKEKPPGQARRGKKTVAKESLYKHINDRIRTIYPGFNVGITTGQKGDVSNRWRHPYRHWCFTPEHWTPDYTRTKRQGKN